MNEGLPEEIPTAVVDLDHSAASRNFIRQLDAMSLTQVTEQPNSFTEARKSLQKGEIYGFLVIPESFEAKAMAGRRPEISFYTNNAYYIPAGLSYSKPYSPTENTDMKLCPNYNLCLRQYMN